MHYTCFSLLGDVGIIAYTWLSKLLRYICLSNCHLQCQMTWIVCPCESLNNSLKWLNHSFWSWPNLLMHYTCFSLLGVVGIIAYVWLSKLLRYICTYNVLWLGLFVLVRVEATLVWLHHSFRTWPNLLVHYTRFSLLGDVGIIAYIWLSKVLQYICLSNCHLQCQMTWTVCPCESLNHSLMTASKLSIFSKSAMQSVFLHLGDVGIILYFGCICLSKCH